MDKQRGIFLIGGSVALLVSAVALTLWTRRTRMEASAKNEKMIDKYEEYVHAEPKPKAKPRPKRVSHAKNGKVAPA